MHAFSHTFASFSTWIRKDHRRLLIAGLVASGLITAISLFAETPAQTNAVDVLRPAIGSTQKEDFAIQVDVKPKQGKKAFNTQVFIDNQLVDVRTEHGGKREIANRSHVFLRSFLVAVT